MQYCATVEIPWWLGYLSYLFNMQFIIFLCLYVLLADNVAKKIKYLFGCYLALYVILTVLAGSRSMLLHSMIYLFSMLFLYKKDVRFKPRHLLLGLILILAMGISFIFATAQRAFREEVGFRISADLLLFNLGRSMDFFSSDSSETIQNTIGMATARAGYLDFGAEMYANDIYANVINIANIAKSTIDQLIPGAIFEDSQGLSQRIRNIYDLSGSTAYQADAINAVGENYILFGYGCPVVIAFVAFVFTSCYLLIGNTVFGIWLKFVLLCNFMFWWNSFGYDWLLLDIARQSVFGSLLLVMLSCKKKVRLFGRERARQSSGVRP